MTGFLLVVEDVFAGGRGRAVLVTGVVARGSVRPRAELAVVGHGGGGSVRVLGIERFGEPVDEALPGMNVGLLLAWTTPVERGQSLATPGSVQAHRVFEAELAVLPGEQGGSDVADGDRLAFYFGPASELGVVTLAGEVVRPVQQGVVTVRLDRAVALEPGQRFAFRHRGRAAGSGWVTRLPG